MPAIIKLPLGTISGLLVVLVMSFVAVTRLSGFALDLKTSGAGAGDLDFEAWAA